MDLPNGDLVAAGAIYCAVKELFAQWHIRIYS